MGRFYFYSCTSALRTLEALFIATIILETINQNSYPLIFNPERSKHNEILIDETPQHAYKRIFGQALQEYNDKQTRPERKIRSYYSHIKKSVKQHPVYEMIVQKVWGNGTQIRQIYDERNLHILSDFRKGISTSELATKYFLSKKSIQRIIREMEKAT